MLSLVLLLVAISLVARWPDTEALEPSQPSRMFSATTLALCTCTFYWSVNVFSTKVLIGDTILRLLMETGPPFYVVIRATRRLAVCSAKEEPSFLSHFKTLSNGPAQGIEPATSRSALKRSTDWVNPATVSSSFRVGIAFLAQSQQKMTFAFWKKAVVKFLE